MPSPYLRSKSVQVSKKASVYAAFHCCRGVQVCPVLVRFPLFLYTCTTIKTPVFMRVCAIVVHFLIPSPGVRDRTGQAAFLRSARAGPSAKAGWRQVKVSSTFSKVVGFGGRYVPVGRCSAADRAGRRDQTPRPSGVARGPGARWAPFRTGLRCHFGRCWASATGRQHPRRQPRPKPLPSPTSQKRGDVCPPLGVAPRPGFLLVEGAGRVPARPGLALSPYGRMRALPCTFSTGCAG